MGWDCEYKYVTGQTGVPYKQRNTETGKYS